MLSGQKIGGESSFNTQKVVFVVWLKWQYSGPDVRQLRVWFMGVDVISRMARPVVPSETWGWFFGVSEGTNGKACTAEHKQKKMPEGPR